MKALRAITRGTPSPVSLLSASRRLEQAWQLLCAARDRWAMSPLGDTDALFRLRDEWIRAIDVYEMARVRHATAVKQSERRRWLRLVPGA